MSERPPDIELVASVKARELRFERLGEAEGGFIGEPGYVSEVWTERDGLPERVEPGVTYRNVTVCWRAALWLDAEALSS